MDRLTDGPTLSPSGLLELVPGEVELLTCDNIDIRLYEIDPSQARQQSSSSSSTRSSSSSLSDSANNISPLDKVSKLITNLICTITTHRVIFCSYNQSVTSMNNNNTNLKATKQIHLNDITKAKNIGGPTFFHPRSKYKLSLNTAIPSLISPFSLTVHIVFPLEDDKSYNTRDDMLSSIQKSISRKLWLEQHRQEEKVRQKDLERKMNRKVGINAIVDQTERRHREAKNITNKVLESNDIDTFMKDASDLITIIQKYVATLENNKKKETSTTKKKNNDEEKLNNMLQDMGITSSLSKERLGNLYHERLARQIHSFLQENKKWNANDSNGIMTVTDFYCLFNRARGTNFISPDDLLLALDIANTKLNLGISRRTLPNTDVMVIIDNTLYSENVMEEKVTNLAIEKCKVGITSLDVSHCCKVSIILADEHLKSVERKEILCRDVTLEGIRFFPNRFHEFSLLT